jgi:DNA-binding winged helix-turn-helix (wHTH) protein
MAVDGRLKFADFSLDPSAGQLFCGNDVVALTPKAFAVLHRLGR